MKKEPFLCLHDYPPMNACRSFSKLSLIEIENKPLLRLKTILNRSKPKKDHPARKLYDERMTDIAREKLKQKKGFYFTSNVKTTPFFC